MADQKVPMTPRGAQRLKDELKRRKVYQWNKQKSFIYSSKLE